jgi:hypothetical protein
MLLIKHLGICYANYDDAIILKSFKKKEIVMTNMDELTGIVLEGGDIWQGHTHFYLFGEMENDREKIFDYRIYGADNYLVLVEDFFDGESGGMFSLPIVVVNQIFPKLARDRLYILAKKKGMSLAQNYGVNFFDKSDMEILRKFNEEKNRRDREIAKIQKVIDKYG